MSVDPQGQDTPGAHTGTPTTAPALGPILGADAHDGEGRIIADGVATPHGPSPLPGSSSGPASLSGLGASTGPGASSGAGSSSGPGASTGRLERSLQRAIANRPSDRLSGVGLLVGPDLPDRHAPAVTAAVNALVAIAARCAAARRVDVVVGLRGDELLVHAQYDGLRPGADPALDLQAALLRSVQRRAEDAGGRVEVQRIAGRTVIRVALPAG